MADFTTLPNGVKILATDPVAEGGDVLSENFAILDAAIRLAKGFVYVQTVPASVWNVTHGLGKPVSLMICDVTGAVVEADVTIIDPNSFEVRFYVAGSLSPFAGKVYVA